MKTLTVVRNIQATFIYHGVDDEVENYSVENLFNREDVRSLEKAMKQDLGADDVNILETHVFVQDQPDTEEYKRKREIRELTDRLLELIFDS